MKKKSHTDTYIKTIKKNVFESIKVKWISSCSSSGMLIPPKALAEFDARMSGLNGGLFFGWTLFRNKTIKQPVTGGNNFQSILNLSNCNLTDDHIYHLIEALKLHSINSSISKIDLSNNNITNIGGNIILNLLRSHSLILKSLSKENDLSNIKKYLEIPWLYDIILSSNAVKNDLLSEIKKLTDYFLITNVSSYIIKKYIEINSNLSHFDVSLINSLWTIIIEENLDNVLSQTFITKNYQDIELLIINRLLTLGKLGQIKSNEVKSLDFFSYSNILQAIEINNILPTINNSSFKSELINNDNNNNNNDLLNLNNSNIDLSNNKYDKNDIFPDGWEQKYNDKGRAYYVDHKNKKTSWTLPKEVNIKTHTNDEMKMNDIKNNETKVLKLDMNEKSNSTEIANIEEEESIASVLEQSRVECIRIEKVRLEIIRMEESIGAAEQCRLEEETRVDSINIEDESIRTTELTKESTNEVEIDEKKIDINTLDSDCCHNIITTIDNVIEEELHTTTKITNNNIDNIKNNDNEGFLNLSDDNKLNKIPLRYRILYDFITNESNELSVVVGDLVEKCYLDYNDKDDLENDYEDSWTLVKSVNILEDGDIIPSLIGYVRIQKLNKYSIYFTY
jgi:hypothetical protein